MWGVPFSRPVDSYSCLAQRAAHQGFYKLFTSNMEYCMFSFRFKYFFFHLTSFVNEDFIAFYNRDINPSLLRKHTRHDNGTGHIYSIQDYLLVNYIY